MTILLALPLVAAVLLALFGALMKPLRKLPAYEYVQLERLPAWLTVVMGGGIVLFSLLALRQMLPDGAQVFFGNDRKAALMVDGYTLWASALLGAVLAVTAWVPAARRSLVPRALPYFVVTLLLAGCAQLMLFSLQFKGILFGWGLLLAGVLLLWAVLFHPKWRWDQLEIFVVLALSAVLGGIGLLWLRGIAHGADITNMWSILLSAPPRPMNEAVLLITLGWLGPAVYLPWWLWVRREEVAMVWMPAAMLLCVTGALVLVRLIFLIFPAGGGDFTQLPGVEHLFLIKRLLGWMLTWGFLSLVLGAGLLLYHVLRKQADRSVALRPIVFVVTGILLLGLAGSVLGLAGGPQGQHLAGIAGVLWLLVTWAGFLTIWLTTGALLPTLARGEQGERSTLLLALMLSLAALIAFPPTTGFQGIYVLWHTWQRFGMPPFVILLILLVAAICVGLQVPAWFRRQVASTARPGVGWGIIGPFAFAVLLLAMGMMAGPLKPVLMLIRQSLLQAF